MQFLALYFALGIACVLFPPAIPIIIIILFLGVATQTFERVNRPARRRKKT